MYATEVNYENGEKTNETEYPTEENDYVEIEFKNDGTFVEFISESYMYNGEEIVETDTDEGTYNVDGNKVEVVYSDGESFESEFSVSGDKLTVTTVTEYTGNDTVYKEVYTVVYKRM